MDWIASAPQMLLGRRMATRGPSSGGVPFSPQALGMDWWEPSLGYTGTTSAVTGLPNQREGGAALSYSGTQPATYSVGAIVFPNAQNDQRLVADSLAAGIGAGENAAFTIGLAFYLTAEAPTATLWSVASATGDTPTRIHLDVSNGFARLFSQSTANVAGNQTTAANIAMGSGWQSLVLVALPNGTYRLWHNGVMIEDGRAWVRGACTDLDQFTFGGLRQGASVARDMQGGFRSMAWSPTALTDADAKKLAAYMHGVANA